MLTRRLVRVTRVEERSAAEDDCIIYVPLREFVIRVCSDDIDIVSGKALRDAVVGRRVIAV